MTEPLEPLAFLNLARELADRNPEEASLRTAVGRAYYALFLVARHKADITRRDKIHKRVADAIKERKGYRATGDQLEALKRLRHVADYELLPARPDDRNWVHNWSKVESYIDQILPKLQAW